MLDPVVARVSANPKVYDTQARFDGIANYLAHSQIPLVACQEANQQSARSLKLKGYDVIGLDATPNNKPELLYANTQSNSWQLADLKRGWTGVQVCFDPVRYSLAPSLKSNFHVYPPQYQKHLGHTIAAALALLWQFVKTPFANPALAIAFTNFFNSLSGPLRTDGLLVSHLQDRLSQEHIVFCATHIESFDRTIAAGQLDSMCELIQTIRREHPQKTIIIAADFNWHVGPGVEKSELEQESIAHFLKRRLGANTMPFEQIGSTLVGQRKAIDGVFFITPSDETRTVQGISLYPASQDKPELELSDHHAVVAQLL